MKKSRPIPTHQQTNCYCFLEIIKKARNAFYTEGSCSLQKVVLLTRGKGATYSMYRIADTHEHRTFLVVVGNFSRLLSEDVAQAEIRNIMTGESFLMERNLKHPLSIFA